MFHDEIFSLFIIETLLWSGVHDSSRRKTDKLLFTSKGPDV